MEVYIGNRVPIKSWCGWPEEGALQQARNMADLPFAYKHIALMPDTHQGFGVCIGGVVAAENVVLPSAVGVDIGCGMCAAKTTLQETPTPERIEEWLGNFRAIIPVGFDRHEEPQNIDMPIGEDEDLPIVKTQLENSKHQIGTLGGGNHFLEIQQDSEGFIWVMVHSGSRNLGHKVATHYTKEAEYLNKRWHSSVPPEHQLSFLPIGDPTTAQYIREMNYCVRFAALNRMIMIGRALSSMQTHETFLLDVAHNYARMENHFGKNVWVHRKGATSAKKDELGIIPGSQGTHSYIVKGKGCADSFTSCSHGAGRKMGRKEAQRILDLETEKQRLDSLGIIHGIRNVSDLDEAAGAYKDIHTVMEEQTDLVEIVTELTPLGVLKG